MAEFITSHRFEGALFIRINQEGAPSLCLSFPLSLFPSFPLLLFYSFCRSPPSLANKDKWDHREMKEMKKRKKGKITWNKK